MGKHTALSVFTILFAREFFCSAETTPYRPDVVE
jgi:hypothetical protein